MVAGMRTRDTETKGASQRVTIEQEKLRSRLSKLDAKLANLRLRQRPSELLHEARHFGERVVQVRGG
jgi:hypothetical protein